MQCSIISLRNTSVNRFIIILLFDFIESVVLKLWISKIVRKLNFWKKKKNNVRNQRIFTFYSRGNAEYVIVNDVHCWWIDGSTVDIRRYLTTFTEIDMPDKWRSLIGTSIWRNGIDEGKQYSTSLSSFPLVLHFKPYCLVRDSDGVYVPEEQCNRHAWTGKFSLIGSTK